MATYHIEPAEIDGKPAYLIVRSDDQHTIGYRYSWKEADAYMASIADPPGTELMMTPDGWKYGLIAPGDQHPEAWSKAFPSHEECLRYARECSRQEAVEQASGYGYNGSFDIQYETARSRRTEKGTPKPDVKHAAVILVAFLAFTGSAHAAKRPACQPIKGADGKIAWARPVKGGWSTRSCEPTYTLHVTDRVKAPAGYEVRPGATAEHCTVWVHPKRFAKVYAEAVDACTDEMARKGGA